MLLILSLSGMAAGAALVADTTAPAIERGEPDEVAADTTLSFDDADGDGVDDDCGDVTVADPAAAAAALTAADLDGDGEISTSEAAQTDWTGGTNCNHGGYVSTVAQDGDETPAEAGEDVEAPAPAECETAVEPETTPEDPTVETDPNAHGKTVSDVARSDATGGKNCNHGGAVSEAAKKDHAAKDHAAKKDHADRSATRNAKGKMAGN